MTYGKSVGASGLTSPPGSRPGSSFAAAAGHHEIYVVTYGSGSCPVLPTGVRARGKHRVDVVVEEHSTSSGACTADLGPTTSLVRLPRTIGVGAPITVHVLGNAGTTDTASRVTPR